ncbi:MAG: methyltransferase domain-containing protein [Fidelibacterota bacterium]|nr:MAG: methyltransferase domain-containing protein [Candidatus Neomarinimicrobiota bacterium]
MPDENKPISRVTRSGDDAKASYNRLSKWYDLMSNWYEGKHRTAALEKLAVQEGETVLEIGFGTGHGLQAMAQAVGGTGKVYGIDISEGMQAVATSRLKTAGLLNRVELTCGDAIPLPYESDHFDAVFMSFVLELFDTPEIPEILGECHRVLRKSGRLGVVALSKSERPGLAERLYEWAHRAFPRFADCRPIYVQQALSEAGFHIQEVAAISMWGLKGEIVLGVK